MNQLLSAPRVLVVDPEPISRTLLDAVLRTDRRYDVLAESGGRQALETARRVRPDLVLISSRLPGEMDGLAVCRTLKAEGRTQRIPVLLVTAHATAQERAQGFEAGADDFILKPFSRVELLARVRSLVRIKALNDQLDEVENVVYSLSRALEMRDGEDEADCGAERVSAYAQALGRAMGLSDESLRLLGQAAMLRDIGTLGLPNSLLQKPGALNEAERGRMQTHSALGERIMAPLRSTASLLPIIRHHHERWDGKGYPDGLCGTDIPLGARIIAIADAYHAMLSPRPYRAALTPEQAQQTLLAGAGRQWDRELVAQFVAWAGSSPRPLPAVK